MRLRRINADDRLRAFKRASATPASQETAMIAPAFLALTLAFPLVATVADNVPAFDTAPGCRAAVRVMPGSFDACMNDEQAARAQLAAQWDKFVASDRATCTQNETAGGSPSYVELLTCLQMARDARGLPADKTDGSNQ
jgi:hypothetical protein